MSHAASLSTSPARSVMSYLQERGYLAEQERSAFLDKLGLSEMALDSDDYRMNVYQYRQLWDMAKTSSNDEAIGLHVGGNSPIEQASLVTCLAAHSDSFESGIESYIKYYDLLNADIKVEMTRENGLATLRFIHLSDDSYVVSEAERVAALIRQRTAFLSKGNIQIERFFFAHSAPSYTEQYQNTLATDLEFDAPYTGFSFPTSALKQKPRISNRYVYRSLVEHATAIKNKLFTKRYTARVEEILRQEPDLSRVDIISVSESLNMNRQTLYRKLKSEGFAFTDILKNVKLARAKEQLGNPEHSLCDIAFGLGFSDSSSFSRAFKTWTGQSPKEYRNRVSAQLLS